MKLVEIKNSLAKLYYKPKDNALVLSDFLTIDDKNQMILAQVVSIESTNKEDTNCAILKFSLNIVNDNFTIYNGYTPSLDASVAVADKSLITFIFSDTTQTISWGRVSNSADADITINRNIFDNTLYIQSDIVEDYQSIFQKIINFNKQQKIKTLIINNDNIKNYENTNKLTLGKEFKLPVSNDILDYIYENDLTGLTVEQKTIVQDIIIDIQDYINTLEEKYIPFDTLLNVVNEIYNTDKSVGVILLRNKLLKYKQYNIFASEPTEIDALKKSIESNTVTSMNLSGINSNWKKETLNFLINSIEEKLSLILRIEDDSMTKNLINDICKSENINSIISSSYDSNSAKQIKSVAKNLILFRPEEQQRAFATYNSFLNKLADKEFIISGEATYYMPLIINGNNTEILSVDNTSCSNFKENVNVKSGNAETPIESLSANSSEPKQDLKNIFEESLENEIAKDVDSMFYVNGEKSAKNETANQSSDEQSSLLNENINNELPLTDSTDIQEETLTDDDLDMLDGFNLEEDEPSLSEGTDNYEGEKESTEQESIIDTDSEETEPIETDSADELGLINIDNDDDSLEELSGDDLPLFDDTTTDENITVDTHAKIQENLPENDNDLPIISYDDSKAQDDNIPSIPIFNAEDSIKSDEKIKIAEGNIKKKKKYGR